jgi:hypothetical protein
MSLVDAEASFDEQCCSDIGIIESMTCRATGRG